MKTDAVTFDAFVAALPYGDLFTRCPQTGSRLLTPKGMKAWMKLASGR